MLQNQPTVVATAQTVVLVGHALMAMPKQCTGINAFFPVQAF